MGAVGRYKMKRCWEKGEEFRVQEKNIRWIHSLRLAKQ